MSGVASPKKSRSPGERRAARSRSGPPPEGARTIGADLERRRLEHRARRLERVLDVLRRRADALGADAPPGLKAALSDFSADLRQARIDLAPPSRVIPAPENSAVALAH
jgi:hypothetical protein